MIKVLEKKIADKIAAGEVVERPLSIIKELVENSIDAGATSIIIEIKNGGKTYIRVSDNGCGINKNEVETAFLRHATSKIETASDLNGIDTLGFRGEALASIAAVTRLEIVTKEKTSQEGKKLYIQGGEIIKNQPTGCPDGTTIIITDLFFNMPARFKFLKSDSSESSVIIDFISQIALAYNHIKFRFINNGNILFSTRGDGNRKSTIISIYRQKEYESLVPLYIEERGNILEGYISPPQISRPTRRNQVFFVNGRVINSKIMEKGVNDGYKERLFDGRFPIVFLFLKTSPYSLDVNIHPNKREIRFDNETSIIDFIKRGIIDTLANKEAVTKVDLTRKSSLFKKEEHKNEKETQVDIKELLSTKSRQNESTKTFNINQLDNTEVSSKIPTEIINDNRVTSPNLTKNKTFNETNLEYTSFAEPWLVPPKSEPFDFNDIEITGAVFGTYITAVDSDNFYLIDQHAAHERIFYEKLVTMYLSDEKIRQPLLLPIVVDVPLVDQQREKLWIVPLNEMGYVVENFGNNSYVIKEIPTYMTMTEAEDFFNYFIENIGDSREIKNQVVIDKLISKSCKSAIKANDYLSHEEMNQLLNDLKLCVNPFSCPHGRPTFIKLCKYDIEKMFKRV